MEVSILLIICTLTIDTLLPQEHVDDELQKQLHFHFHSADYHTLVEVVTGLNIVAWYLLKVRKLLYC